MNSASQVIGQQSAGKVLAKIVSTYRGRLSVTSTLVMAENALDLIYPLAAGMAIDAVIRGDIPRALGMVAIIFGFWLIGAVRRAVDTRVYAGIYADLASSLVVSERRRGVKSSVMIAHTALARQFVDFFEIQMPVLVTAAVSIIGSVTMLMVLAPVIGLLAAAMLALAVVIALRLMSRTEFYAACLHSRQEQEPNVVTHARALCIARHFRILGGRRIQLSDMEASAYVGIGLIATTLFAALFIHLALAGDATAGFLFTLMSYVWTFVFSLDELPQHVQQIGRLRELGSRITPDMDRDAPAVPA